MRISSMRQVFGVLTAFALSCASISGGYASEPAGREASHRNSMSLENEHVGQGLAALHQAAQKGNLGALLRIAELFDKGKGVPQDRLKACQIYGVSADIYAKISRFDEGAEMVAMAFRKAAECYAGGLEARGWKKNLRTAAEFYYHAAVRLQDPESAFELARLYLSGEGIPQNTTLAIQMLEIAVRKRYAPAQALLGSMMWEGRVMKRRPEAGLALLILGKERTKPENRTWITSMHDDAIITATKDVERQARALVDKWKSINGGSANEPLEAVRTVKVPAPAPSPTRGFKGLNLDILTGTDTFSTQPTDANISPSAGDPLD